MDMCVYLKVVGERQSNIPRPMYKSSEELDVLWREYHDSKKQQIVPNLATISQVAGGSGTGMALTATGNVYTWGTIYIINLT